MKTKSCFLVTILFRKRNKDEKLKTSRKIPAFALKDEICLVIVTNLFKAPHLSSLVNELKTHEFLV